MDRAFTYVKRAIGLFFEEYREKTALWFSGKQNLDLWVCRLFERQVLSLATPPCVERSDDVIISFERRRVGCPTPRFMMQSHLPQLSLFHATNFLITVRITSQHWSPISNSNTLSEWFSDLKRGGPIRLCWEVCPDPSLCTNSSGMDFGANLHRRLVLSIGFCIYRFLQRKQK